MFDFDSIFSCKSVAGKAFAVGAAKTAAKAVAPAVGGVIASVGLTGTAAAAAAVVAPAAIAVGIGALATATWDAILGD